MAKKRTTTAKRSTKPHSTTTSRKPSRSRTAGQSKRSADSHPNVENRDVEHEAHADRGALMEHFRGERTRGERTGEAGSLDEETLDRGAPYNRTYGRVESETA